MPRDTPPAPAEARASKRSYHAPRLTLLGTLTDVTRTSANGSNTDGGSTPPEIYTS